MKVKDLMNTSPTTIFSHDTIQKAAEEMARASHGFLTVLHTVADKRVIGVVSNQDIIEKVLAKGKDPKEITVENIMTPDIVHISPDASSAAALQLMRKYRIKRILVIENQVLLGIVTSNDILDAMMKYKKDLLDMAIDL
ncbi:CBS domain-containing protein [Candidatus Woesearchaeota archaeon]|nr:CBS domain-containing protein [Candidatus Woesearchaeota archaeon]